VEDGTTKPFAHRSSFNYFTVGLESRMFVKRITAALATTLSVATAYKPCPPLGPVFQAPTSLCSDDIFQAALKNLTSILDNATASEISSYGPFAASTNSFSIGIYNADETLFSYQWTAPPLRNSSEGVRDITENSVYRVSFIFPNFSSGNLNSELTTSFFTDR
jgi:hypothetical protein